MYSLIPIKFQQTCKVMVMAVLPFSEALVVACISTGAAAVGPSNEFHRLASVFSGIIMCTTVYNFTGFMSLLCFKGYSKLSNSQKVEWNNRGFSTIHALIVASASLYLLLWSGLFDEDSQDELIVNRSSVLSNSIFGISIGYFLSDLSMILWCFPALGGLEYVLHHCLSMYSILLSLISDQGQIYILMVLFTEITTPFVNLRWYLDCAGQKNSKLYICNGVLLFLVWLVLVNSKSLQFYVACKHKAACSLVAWCAAFYSGINSSPANLVVVQGYLFGWLVVIYLFSHLLHLTSLLDYSWLAEHQTRLVHMFKAGS